MHCFLLAFLPVQVMVTNVTSLLKTVKAVEDEATRGTRALEATIEYMKQELTVRSHSHLPPAGTPVQPLSPAQASLSLFVSTKRSYPEHLR